jgi:hypothetical protein
VDRPDINIELVMRRCTAFAAEFLIELSLHPAYPAILAKLEEFDGQIFRGDIEQALFEYLEAARSQNAGEACNEAGKVAHASSLKTRVMA